MAHGQFLHWRYSAKRHVGPFVVVCPQPPGGSILHLLNRCKNILVQPVVPDRPVIALHIGILLRLSGLDEEQRNFVLFRPGRQLVGDVFGAIVRPDGIGPAAPLDDLIEGANDTFRRQGEVDLDAQSLTVVIIDDVKSPEAPPIAELVMHKIHGPGLVDRRWHRQGLWLLPVQAFPRLDPQVQLQFPVNTINPTFPR